VDVISLCDANADAIAVKVKSKLIAEKRIKIQLVLPFPTGGWTDEGTNHADSSKHKSLIIAQNNASAIVQHQIDTCIYHIGFQWKGAASLKKSLAHQFVLEPSTSTNSFEFVANFSIAASKQKIVLIKHNLIVKNFGNTIGNLELLLIFRKQRSARF